jgi:RNA polymerase sigma factor (sigma-70 family)
MDNQKAIEFSELLNQVRDGSELAAWELVERYGDHILRAVRRRLSCEIRSKFDSADFVQAVWASFFACSHRIKQIASPEELSALLATIARNKVINELRKRLSSRKYDVRREIPIMGLDPTTKSNATPSAIAIAKERWRALVDNQPSHFRRIISLRLAGDTQAEIAEKLQVSERTVRRVLVRLLSTLEP